MLEITSNIDFQKSKIRVYWLQKSGHLFHPIGGPVTLADCELK